MKTRRNIYGGLMMTAAALLCLAGCKKDEGEKITLGVDFEQTAGMQKTYIGNGERTIYWNTGDSVKINGTVCEVHDGAVEVTLSDDGYTAVYPKTGTLNGSGKNCTGGSVEIPATQNYTADANGVQQLNAPMAARLDSKTGRLLFRNLYAVVKVKVKTGNDAFTLNSITLKSTNDKVLAGTQPFTFTTSQKTGKTDSVSLSSVSTGRLSVTLTGIGINIPANSSDSFYLYTMPFSGANLIVRLNGSLTDKNTHSRNNIGIGRSNLSSTTVEQQQLQSIPVFSVAPDRYVTFSPGNLQYQASTNTWRFAEHQWDYVGDSSVGTVYEGGVKCDNTKFSSTYSGWKDLFGWGTSGYNGKYPYMTSKNDSVYGNGDEDIAGTNYDWGVYNAIQSYDGSTTYPAGTWRTLKRLEWAYLVETIVYLTPTPLKILTTTRGSANPDWWIFNLVRIKAADGTNNVFGMIIYPDGVTENDLPADIINIPDFIQNSYIEVEISATQFAALEAMGCVFLPAAGYMDPDHNGKPFMRTFEKGVYWSSSSPDVGGNDAWHFSFNTYNYRYPHNNINPYTNYYRSRNMSVRLVKDVE